MSIKRFLYFEGILQRGFFCQIGVIGKGKTDDGDGVGRQAKRGGSRPLAENERRWGISWRSSCFFKGSVV